LRIIPNSLTNTLPLIRKDITQYYSQHLVP